MAMQHDLNPGTRRHISADGEGGISGGEGGGGEGVWEAVGRPSRWFCTYLFTIFHPQSFWVALQYPVSLCTNKRLLPTRARGAGDSDADPLAQTLSPRGQPERAPIAPQRRFDREKQARALGPQTRAQAQHTASQHV